MRIIKVNQKTGIVTDSKHGENTFSEWLLKIDRDAWWECVKEKYQL